MKIELLYFDGCPSHERLRPLVEQLVREHGVTEPVELRRVDSPEDAEAEQFLGSPTVRVDGEDIEPGAGERTDYGLKCRLYRSGQRATGMPAEEWIRSALERATE